MKNAVVLDIEASGLEVGSYPIEIAWIGVLDNAFDNFLIKPDKEWILWDSLAQEVHGISRMVIERAGITACEATTRLDHFLKYKEIYSDAPEWDGYWLDRLYSSVNKKREWRLEKIKIDYNDLNLVVAPHRALVDAECLAQYLRG